MLQSAMLEYTLPANASGFLYILYPLSMHSQQRMMMMHKRETNNKNRRRGETANWFVCVVYVSMMMIGSRERVLDCFVCN